MSSADILQQLTQETESRIASLEVRTKQSVDLESTFADIQHKFEAAEQISDEKERDLRMEILNAQLNEVRKAAQKEEEDLAQAVFGLNSLIENLGAEYTELANPSPEEQKIIQKAQDALMDAQAQLRNAEQARWFKELKIQNAQAAIQKAEANLKAAKLEAAQRGRQRLLNADMESSLQEFMIRVDKTIRIMEERVTAVNGQINAVKIRKAKAFEIKEQAAKMLEKFDQDLGVKEAELKREEELESTFINGSPEHAQQVEKISNLRAEVESLRGKRNVAFILYQSKEKFAAELEIHERTQMKLRDNQLMWITSLQSDTEERVITFRSRLEAMKAASDQDIAKNLDDLGAAVDQANAEYMAKIGYASDKLRMEKIEKHPERIAKLAQVQAAQAEAVQKIRQREQKQIDAWKERWGIDPTQSSFFHYAGKGDDGGESEPANAGLF